MKTVTITKDRFEGRGESKEYDWYICPMCESDSIVRGDNYCCNCGAKIQWKLGK